MKNITAALIKVQSEMGAVEKNKVNPFYKSRYADLQSIWDTAKKVLNKNGLAITQTTGIENGAFGLVTELLHESGEKIRGFYVLTPSKPNDPQAMAAATTYARRVALSAILSIVTDEDDDGNAATGNVVSHTAIPEAVNKVFPTAKKTSQDTAKGDQRTTTFIPADVTEKTGVSKAGKDYTSYSIVSPDGVSFSTLDAELVGLANEALTYKTPILVTYTQVGQYFNLVRVEDVKLEETSL